VIGRLLRVVGEVYLPFLLANASALDAGEETFAMTAMGLPYRQGVFKYQVKCLAELRARYAALDAAARGRIDPLLDETNIRKAL
jgi:hypothetical protein